MPPMPSILLIGCQPYTTYGYSVQHKSTVIEHPPSFLLTTMLSTTGKGPHREIHWECPCMHAIDQEIYHICEPNLVCRQCSHYWKDYKFTHLVEKPVQDGTKEFLSQAEAIFGDTQVQITSEGRLHLGVPLGTPECRTVCI